MRGRLALLVAATTSLILVAFLVPLALLVRTVAEDRALHAANVDAQSFSSLLATADPEVIRLAVERVNLSDDHQLTIFLPDGTTVGEPAERTESVDLALRGHTFTADVGGGMELLVNAQDSTGEQAAVRAHVPAEVLHRGVDRAVLILVLLAVVLLAVSALVADRLATSLVRPTTQLAAVSHRLARGELQARADPTGPKELRDVGLALNHLAGQIETLLQQERETVADISHRLRTPLTALKLEAEGLRSPEEARRVEGLVEELERAVSEVIQDARGRSGGDGQTAARVACDAAQIVSERVRFWSVLAEDTERHVELDLAPGPLLVRVSPGELVAAVDALLGNVFAHTEEGTSFAVRLRPAPEGGAVLVVADAGAGFGGVNTGRHVLDRGNSKGGSTGLGLDIARRTAEASGGGMSLGVSGWGGAQITVRLGPPEPS
ncbi:sensor histidine kinase [Actinoalloteichus spitiensis]|uniref:sensor histidine kinase n=1 Tax=Actinoalloteichus spitiensis TaxID=252394 RepID=UPI000474B235|nr:HAMP domain-containing sensor histidine kinase [Actinoalloteichus spitiensis]